VAKRLKDLGLYTDLVRAAKRTTGVWPKPVPGEKTRKAFLKALNFAPSEPTPKSVRVDRTWKKDGVSGEAVSWSVGYGPRTEGWILKPAGAKGPLPGIVALHDHGGVKFYGKEKIADDNRKPTDYLRQFRDHCYEGRAWANDLAREGYVVLAHDTFLWGSRKFPYETMGFQRQAERLTAGAYPYGAPKEIGLYDAAAGAHESLVEKYCHVLGTTFAGIVTHEDRIAVNYLLGRPDVSGKGVGCVGLSGGGMRSTLLQATTKEIAAAVIVGAMTTFEEMLDHNIRTHTWLFFPSGWPVIGDWSDAAACRAPSPLMVQNDLEDPLYTVKGMKAAHRRVASHYKSKGKPGNYEGRFYPGTHKFDLEMQRDAFAFLKKWLT